MPHNKLHCVHYMTESAITSILPVMGDLVFHHKHEAS